MKHLKLSAAIIFSSCLLFECTGNNSSDNRTNRDAKTSTSDSKTESADANLTGRNGSFSYTIDGQHIVTANNVQNANLFINEVSNDVANGMAKIEVTCAGSNVFKFGIANSGTTTITSYSPSLTDITDKKAKEADYMDGKTLKNFYAVSATVTITGINDSRISGTFSGTYKADKHDTGSATATITDGSFNLPFVKN
jgi:hypothetical protein